MDRASIDVIVAVLVEDLMTNGAQQRAERLRLVASDGRDLGGWSARALQERIRRHFEPFEDVIVNVTLDGQQIAQSVVEHRREHRRESGGRRDEALRERDHDGRRQDERRDDWRQT